MLYIIAPFLGWFISGCMKFAINYIKYGSEAKRMIGNGGFPSTHTTIITTTVILIGWREGFTSAIFGLGIAVLYIVIIDATGLRRAVGKQAIAINKLCSDNNLRESMGHTRIEILGGLILGGLLGTLLWLWSYLIGLS
ncbi:divergent PAP2 family protein [Paenibacillus sp. SYP-B3998]|uniref:Divergent PAP2 family protein n=1 Tax=Paenibacillus sp. SYP-B3998 TaxID=2678564 RepID=A0A6G3ZYG2_9BACL|nr:divergent PAP2 family protein [Paenibacillus sp. SYP-B3998]NEW07088.1 divergent PAP2 family protein [Paenibacillus sp. SYP-B3998]